MSVTRQDFVAIAEAVKGQRWTIETMSERAKVRNVALDDVAIALATHLESRNPAFDRKRFLKACGVAS